MTLYTDRRAIQTTSIDRVAAARRLLRPAALLGLLAARHHRRPRPRRSGCVEVWSDATWILWQLPDAGATCAESRR